MKIFNVNNKENLWLLLPVTSFLFFILAMSPIEAFDTFWQLQSGKYIWRTGNFIYTDIFSLAFDAYRLEHCWLFDIILYISYITGGYALIGLVWCAGLGLLAIVLLPNRNKPGTSRSKGPTTVAAVLLLILPMLLFQSMYLSSTVSFWRGQCHRRRW